MTTSEIARTDAEAPAPKEANQLLRLALENKVPVETIERLTTLYERAADRHAAQEFNRALSEFQAACPPIEKRTESAQFSVTRNGIKKPVRYAELDQIARTIAPHLHPLGLSYTWDSSLSEGGRMLTCVCILRHENGHETRASFTGPAGSNAGASEIQKTAAALTYAKRQSLVQVLGLTTCDPDTDGDTETSVNGRDTLSGEQLANLECLIQETETDRGKFLERLQKQLGVRKLEDVRAADYPRVVAALEAKRRSGS